jgi:NadR type nicotinamide-nucleotide adenylyltransferase
VTVTGSECTGKTTLAEALARHYRTLWVPEYARQFVLDKGAPPEAGDVDAIARGQIALEDSVARSASGLLILDTDLLSTVVYSRHYYGECPGWIESALAGRLANLYLLADIDVPWLPEPNLHDRGDMREEMQALFRAALDSRRLPYLVVSGSHLARIAAAVRAIDALIGR